MILADKIILLRKKNGWSQEELADRMHVSRQAVSKWEAAQTTPDLERILLLGKLFGVTTDYLLKDELESEEFTEDISDSACRQVTMEEAGSYLSFRKWASSRIALATFLCILSPICLILLAGAAEIPDGQLPDSFLVFFGLAVLFVLVAIAVAIFIYVGFKNNPYAYLDDAAFELSYGVAGMVRERQKAFRHTYIKTNIIATCLCILAPVILLLGVFTGSAMLTVVFLSAMLMTVGVAVSMFITVGVKWASMERLLREGEFAPKKESQLRSTVETVYWLLVTAIYLSWSFAAGSWNISWVIWPVAGVLFAALIAIVDFLEEKADKK